MARDNNNNGGPMTSPVFKAKTGHTARKPQLCGLSGRKIQKGDDILYLTCEGSDARPEQQILIVGYEEKTYRGKTKQVAQHEGPRGFKWKTVPSGNYRTIGKGTRWEKRVPIYKWVEERDGVMHNVIVWENAVLASVATEMGYKLGLTVSGKIRRTVARKGDRTEGYAHNVGDPENPLLALARLAPEEDEVGDG